MYKLVSLFGVIISIWYLVQYITTNGVVFPVVLFGHSSHFAFCLTICFTVCLYTQKSIQSSEKVIFSIMAFIIAITLLLLNSRLGALFSFAIMLRDLFHWKYKNILFVSFFCAIILAVYYKTDSSNGRLFIYMQSILMAQEKPFLGWGNGGFAANYMKWQASYFASNPDSPYVMLADNIHHPLSEFLLVLTNFGLVGLCVLICVCFFFFFYSRQIQNEKAELGVQLISCILFFSLFSYPFQNRLLIWTVLFYGLYLICGKSLKISIYNIFLLSLALFSGIFVYTYANRNKIKSIYEWKSLSNSFKNIKSVTAYRQYGQLYADLKDDCCFLYDYAYMLHEKGEYDKALMIIKECDKKIADYDVILLMGDIYNDMGNYSKAIDCYTLAHNMCPCRFAPLCAIYDVYKQQCKITECKLLARKIMEKKIKVRSPETMEYVNYIEKEIKILNL